MQTAKILIIDDDSNILRTLSSRLESAGFTALTANHAVKGLAQAESERPDLIILDLHLGETDGFEVCKRLRDNALTQEIPVLFLSGESRETFKVYGLGIGADDYMVKPFNPTELIARIQAILRRSNSAFSDHNRKVLMIENLALDLGTGELTVRAVKRELSRKETELLHCLWTAKGKILTREDLLEKVWGYQRGHTITTRTVDVHVRTLRRKLGEEAWRVMTVKNQGYRFEKRSQAPE